MISSTTLYRYLSITTLKLLPYRADLSILDQVTSTANIRIAADLAKLRADSQILNSQELEELSTRIQALEEIAKLEDRLKVLENRKRPRLHDPEQSS